MTASATPLLEQEAVRPSRLHWPRYSLAGMTGALLFGCASFTPSLAPRGWLLQGIVNGFSAAVGYGLGVFLAWFALAVSGRSVSATVTRRLWIVFACLGAPLLAWSLWLGHRWQHEIHELTGLDPPTSYEWIRILLLTLLVFVVIVAVARALRWLVRRVTRLLGPYVPGRWARPVAVLLVALVLIALNNEVLRRGLMSATNAVFGAVNGTTNEGSLRPMAPERSGSPASLISWESLGRQGRDFVALGPTVADLTAFSGVPGQQPVRVYAGLKSAETTEQRTALAVRDLRRAGGFDRAVLVVATTTGTGLVDPAAAEAIEYMYNGDTAMVGLQYSYLPSWISFLADHEKAEQAGRELFNQVYDVWASLDADRRPKLLVTGTSLGVFGSEAAFAGETEIRRRTDGAVWAGPPKASRLHQKFVEERDPGTPEWHPVYDAGRTVRFLAGPSDPGPPGTARTRPRAVYLQNGSDPVVFWSPRLAFDKPDWLSEPRAPDVSPDMFWIPVVTFWQMTADLASEYGVPAGYGHRYLELYVDGWATVAPPEGWTPKDSRRLRAQLRLNQIARDQAALDAAR